MGDFKKLAVWRKAHELALDVYRATSRFPSNELYGLTSQTRRAVVSIPANLAEGYGRGGDAELARFCRIALGSLRELEYHLLLARDLHFLESADHVKLDASVANVRSMLLAFLSRVAGSVREEVSEYQVERYDPV
jgi:four helix bundle protein